MLWQSRHTAIIKLHVTYVSLKLDSISTSTFYIYIFFDTSELGYGWTYGVEIAAIVVDFMAAGLTFSADRYY